MFSYLLLRVFFLAFYFHFFFCLPSLCLSTAAGWQRGKAVVEEGFPDCPFAQPSPCTGLITLPPSPLHCLPLLLLLPQAAVFCRPVPMVKPPRNLIFCPDSFLALSVCLCVCVSVCMCVFCPPAHLQQCVSPSASFPFLPVCLLESGVFPEFLTVCLITCFWVLDLVMYTSLSVFPFMLDSYFFNKPARRSHDCLSLSLSACMCVYLYLLLCLSVCLYLSSYCTCLAVSLSVTLFSCPHLPAWFISHSTSHIAVCFLCWQLGVSVFTLYLLVNLQIIWSYLLSIYAYYKMLFTVKFFYA